MKLALALSFLLATAHAFVVPNAAPLLPKTSSSQLSSAATTTTALDAPPPLAPLTRWGDKIADIRQLQQDVKAASSSLPEFAPTVSAIKDCGLPAGDTTAQLQYLQANARKFQQMMQDHGAVVFRDWDLMKTSEGFQQFYQAIGMKVCLDPLHSVSARPTVDGQKNSPVYEAVNKESRKNFFIGTLAVFFCVLWSVRRQDL